MEDWKTILQPISINKEQKDKILKGKMDAHEGKVKLLNIFGTIPDSIWEVKHTAKLDMKDRSQHKVSDEHRNDTLKLFDNSTRNQNVRWKGAISMFPKQILDQLLDFYTKEGDWFFDPFCVSGDTLISLPEGNIPIRELVGKEPYVFCSDGTNIKLRRAHNIRKTRSNVEVLSIEIDNKEKIYVTPNHRFMLRNGTWAEAKDLKEGDSLMPFYRKKHKQSGRWLIRKSSGVWERQNRFIMEELLGRKLENGEEVHHKDNDVTNDVVGNLEVLSSSEHDKLHHPVGITIYSPTEETKEKISKITTGSGNPFYGRNHTKQTKKLIGQKTKGRNLGKELSIQTRERQSLTKKRSDYVKRIRILLDEDKYTHEEIAKIVGVHRNTVGNISRNKFNYNHKIISIKKHEKTMDVYNMEVEEFHNFVANGVIVHNCGHNSRMEPTFLKNRNYIGWDCSKEFMKFNREVREELMRNNPKGIQIILKEGDSRNIDDPDNSMDFIFSSPPYWNIEYYGDEPEQLGNLTYAEFIHNITSIYRHCFRVLKPGKFCIINVNDFRKGGEYYSYHVDTVNALKSVGFKQFDHIIMRYQNSMRKCFPNQIWEEKLMPKQHEHLLVFLKPDPSKPGAFPWL